MMVEMHDHPAVMARETRRNSPAAVELRVLPSASNSHPSTRHEHASPTQVEEGKALKDDIIVSVEEAEVRDANHLPSPTPEEAAFLARDGIFDWERMKDWRFWVRRRWIVRYIVMGLMIAMAVVLAKEHRRIVRWFEPIGVKIKNMPAGFLIPIGVLIILSFPPLHGHELVVLLCGLIYGLWFGFGVVAIGILLGEIANYYAFRNWCTVRGTKLEKRDLRYACFAELVRTGGFKVAVAARFSLIPGHFTTAVFSTCGISILKFTLAAIVSLPKHLALVYVGVAYGESADGTETAPTRTITISVLVAHGIMTFVALRYVMHQMQKIKGHVVDERRKARQMKSVIKNRNHSIGTAVTEVRVPVPRTAVAAAVLDRELKESS